VLKAINLSISSLCGANCLFCPSNRGKRIKQKVMPLEYVKKIICEITSDKFRTYHNIKRIEVGENGDAFLNKDFIDILRLIKSKIPQVNLERYTNFQNFTKEKARIILSEELIDSFYCNIDSSNNSNYLNIKGLDLDNTMNNLINFIKLRKELNSNAPLNVLVLTLNKYINTIYNNYNFYPIKLNDINLRNVPDDFSIIKTRLKKILDSKTDKVIESWVVGWAEREKIDITKIDYAKYYCPNLIRVENEAFIAPDGTWYACCLDSNNELVLGNVIKKSINEIFFSKRRKELISMLKKKKFARINGPCATVNCCQYLNKSKFMTSVFDKILKNKFLTNTFYNILTK